MDQRSDRGAVSRRTEVDRIGVDRLLREVESSATQAIRRELKDLREEVEKLRDSVYVSKTWLTLQEARRYVDVSRTTLRSWREKGLPEANVEGRVYIKREDLDAFIGSHA